MATTSFNRLVAAGLLLEALAFGHSARADDRAVNAFGTELAPAWAKCPFVLFMAQRKANETLNLSLDGKVVLSGSTAPRIDYAVKLRRGWLRVHVAASQKSHERTSWHAPDTDPANRHVLQVEGPGLAASIEAADLKSPLVALFQSAVQECLGFPAAP